MAKEVIMCKAFVSKKESKTNQCLGCSYDKNTCISHRNQEEEIVKKKKNDAVNEKNLDSFIRLCATQGKDLGELEQDFFWEFDGNQWSNLNSCVKKENHLIAYFIAYCCKNGEKRNILLPIYTKFCNYQKCIKKQ